MITVKIEDGRESFEVEEEALEKSGHFRSKIARKPNRKVIKQHDIKSGDFEVILHWLYHNRVKPDALDDSHNKSEKLARLCVHSHALEIMDLHGELAQMLTLRVNQGDTEQFLDAILRVYRGDSANPNFRMSLRQHAAGLFKPSPEAPPLYVSKLISDGGYLAEDIYRCRGIVAQHQIRELETRIGQLEASVASAEVQRQLLQPQQLVHRTQRQQVALTLTGNRWSLIFRGSRWSLNPGGSRWFIILHGSKWSFNPGGSSW